MNLNIDLQTMFAFYKKGKISRYALEMKMIDHAIDKSSIRGIDVELYDETKGFAILYVPTISTAQTVQMKLLVNNGIFALLGEQAIEDLFNIMIENVFNEAGKFHKFQRENEGRQLDLDELVEAYADLLKCSNGYLAELRDANM